MKPRIEKPRVIKAVLEHGKTAPSKNIGIATDTHGNITDYTIDGVTQSGAPKHILQMPSLQRPREMFRPGEVLAYCIRQITGVARCLSQLCPERQALMNEWGWVRCWKNRKTIEGWLEQEAKNRGHRIEPAVIRSLIKAAFVELGYRVKKSR